MKYSLLVFLLVFIQIQLSFSFAGQDVGNGGDLIFCKADSAKNQFEGFYSLDYLLANSVEHSQLRQVLNINESLNRIEKLLYEKLPELWASFHDFRIHLYKNDLLSTRIWESAPSQLIDIPDEQLGLSDRIPDNCKGPKGVKISQAVIHLSPGYSGVGPGVTMYRFMPEIITKVSKERPLQVSFLLIHEWLWDHSSNVDRNRRLNKFFHSISFESMTRSQILTLLGHLGLSIEQGQFGSFNPGFYSFSCPHDNKKFTSLISKKPMNEMYLFKKDSFKLYRYRECEAKGCQPWKTNDSIAAERTYLFLDNESKKLFFKRSKDDHYFNDLELRCTSGAMGVECNRINESQVFIGSANGACLRVDLFEAGQASSTNQKWIEYHYSYFATLD